MKTKIEIAKKQIQQNNDNNKLKRGRKMKYFSIIFTVMVTALIGSNTEPQTDWEFVQSTLQTFYMLEEITIDGEDAEGDGSGTDGDCCVNSGGCIDEGDDGTCDHEINTDPSDDCDVVAAFRRGICSDPSQQAGGQATCEIFGHTWNTDEEICVGWVYADAAGDMSPSGSANPVNRGITQTASMP